MATSGRYAADRGRNTRGNTTRTHSGSYRNPRNEQYIYGNTARALRPIEEEIRSPKKLSNKARRNIDRDTSMNPGFLVFLTLAMIVTGVACIRYIQLQSSVTSYVKKLSAMEIQLEGLRAENDDYESRIKGAIGLENIKKRAMDELGMSYASDEQIVVYESDGTDYVRQFVSLE